MRTNAKISGWPLDVEIEEVAEFPSSGVEWKCTILIKADIGCDELEIVILSKGGCEPNSHFKGIHNKWLRLDQLHIQPLILLYFP